MRYHSLGGFATNLITLNDNILTSGRAGVQSQYFYSILMRLTCRVGCIDYLEGSFEDDR